MEIQSKSKPELKILHETAQTAENDFLLKFGNPLEANLDELDLQFLV